MNKFNSILLIDDDEISNFLCEETIKYSNISGDVKSFVNADEATDFLCGCTPQNLPDLIFLDINMPGTDGWDFLEDLEKISKSAKKMIKVVILSSSNFHIDKEKSRKFVSVKDYVSKPLTSQVLETILEKYSKNDLSASYC
jgi:two-component SAPR family response regulator